MHEKVYLNTTISFRSRLAAVQKPVTGNCFVMNVTC
jgi:hypothetical protein